MIRRARPLLGTLVDITVFDQSILAIEAIEAAFSRIAQIGERLSFHSPTSELSNFNNSNIGEIFSVSEDFINVISCCVELNNKTAGIFNPAVARLLQKLQLLPRFNFETESHLSPLEDAFEILPTNNIKLTKKVCLDFGGIAKGYAVDAACEVLQSCGVKDALVNAGGDIRSIGSSSYPISIRNPEYLERSAVTVSIQAQAIATSASYFTSSIIDGRNGAMSKTKNSISILASSCMIADALTKVAFFMGDDEMEDLLEYYDAEMLVATTDTCTSPLVTKIAESRRSL